MINFGQAESAAGYSHPEISCPEAFAWNQLPSINCQESIAQAHLPGINCLEIFLSGKISRT
jgi:hypothetical protein